MAALSDILIAVPHRQREEPLRLTVSEQRRVADDQVRHHEHDEKEPEDEIQDALREQRAHERKSVEIPEPGLEQHEAEHEVAEDEAREDEDEQRRFAP